MVADSSSAVEITAQRLRDGLGALVALISGGLLIGGPGRGELDDSWRIAAAVLTVMGLAAAGCGFVLALRITARVPTRVSLPAIQARFGSLVAWQSAAAASQLKWLRAVEGAVVATLVFLIAGAAVWTLAPEASPPAVIVTVGDTEVCGALESADGGVLRVRVDGQHALTAVPFAQVVNVKTVSTCP